MRGRLPLEGALKLDLRAVFEVPASWSKAKRVAAMVGEVRPTTKPDVDNIIKAWADAMEGVCYFNDTQIVVVHARKEYGVEALVVVTVSAL